MDIVERLRQPMAWAKVWGGTVQADTAPTDAADEIVRLRAELEKIANPIGHFQTQAALGGLNLDGAMVIALSNDANYLRGIAQDALSANVSLQTGEKP